MEAEAYVGGILRGGYLVDGLFIFHAGTVRYEAKDFRLVSIFN